MRDIEVKSNLTIARGEWRGDSGERGFLELLLRTQEQNHWGGWRWGREGFQLGWGGGLVSNGIQL